MENISKSILVESKNLIQCNESIYIKMEDMPGTSTASHVEFCRVSFDKEKVRVNINFNIVKGVRHRSMTSVTVIMKQTAENPAICTRQQGAYDYGNLGNSGNLRMNDIVNARLYKETSADEITFFLLPVMLEQLNIFKQNKENEVERLPKNSDEVN